MRWENATPSFRVFLLIEDLVCKHGVVMVEGRNGGAGMGPLQSSNKHTRLIFPGVDVVNHPQQKQWKEEKVYFVDSSRTDTVVMVGKAQ